MIKNYFIIGFRNLGKNPMLSFIKIVGLSVGVCGCLVIFLIARYELSFDRFHPGSDRIFRIYSEFSGVFSNINRGVPAVLPSKVRDEFTGIEVVSAFHTFYTKVIIKKAGSDDLKLDKDNKVILVDPGYFKIFKAYRWIAGNEAVMSKPFNTVLTASRAEMYFGSSKPEDVIGKQVIYSDSIETTVAGIVADPEELTDLDFTDFVSFATIEKSWLKDNYGLDDWTSTNSSSQCFIKLAEGTDLAKVQSQMTILNEAKKAKDSPDNKTITEFKLQPLDDIHFNKEIGIFDQGRSPVSLSTLKSLMGMAALILIIAAINFVNLETAQAVRRSKEVGLRKAMGGTRSSLVLHFLVESTVLTAIALLLALPLASTTFWLYGEFMPPGIGLSLSEPLVFIFLLTTLVVISLFAGLYPAFVLSSYQPAVALKNQGASGQSRTAALRKVLTVFQFSFSQALIVVALIVGWQIDFMLNKDLGFSQDSIIQIYTPWGQKESKRENFKNELNQIAGVSAVTQDYRPPAWNGTTSTTMTYVQDGEKLQHTTYRLTGDTSYLNVFGLKVIAGRNVQPVDSLNEILVNETYCKELGIEPIDMVGQSIQGNRRDWTIVGVMKDFHYRSLHKPIEPVTFSYDARNYAFSVKLATAGKGTGDMAVVLDQVKEAWTKVYPDQELSFSFVDETVGKFYQEERRTAKLANTATGLAIFISCLGLLGLASFTTLQRTKEIGIRKVLGATVESIVFLLSKEFLVLVGIAFVVGAPVAWYVASGWLDTFAYHLEIGWWIFALGGLLSFVTAFITVGSQALTAANNNPVDSLRYE